MKNEDSFHGLFGKLEVGEIQQFEKWQDIARLVYQNSQNNITMYCGIISMSDETAAKLELENKSKWERYIEKHIFILAEKNNIKREDFAFVCAIHNEKKHPHVHIAFWDKSNKVRSQFVPPKIPNDIRRELIRNTFKNEILEFSKTKDEIAKSLRSITSEMVDDFEASFGKLNLKEYREIIVHYTDKDKGVYDFNFDDKLLNIVADRMLQMKKSLPQTGRLSYQLLPEENKKQLDSVVSQMLWNNKALQRFVDNYVEAKMQVVHLYGGSDDYLNERSKAFRKEAETMIANGILKTIRSLKNIEYNARNRAYTKHKKDQLASQMLYGFMEMFRKATKNANKDFDKMADDSAKSLSKETLEELYLKKQDKGFEH